MSKNTNLNKAAKAKEDEFYTKLTDIEKEVNLYKEQLLNKVIFCNCDDPEWSNFWRYFYLNFEHIGIKKLISTHFEDTKPSYKLEYDGKNIVKTDLKQNGDFRSPECINILDEVDVVITNPPFSLFKQYLKILIEKEKKFLIIGSQNNITYKEVFPLIKSNKIWLGYKSGDMEFTVPDYYEPRATRYREENGVKYRSMGNICWFTNLDTTKRHENLVLYKTFNEAEYTKYDDYEAINVDKVVDIPMDYFGMMGVPITFIDKYNPNQFEIIDMITPRINGKAKYKRLIVKSIK